MPRLDGDVFRFGTAIEYTPKFNVERFCKAKLAVDEVQTCYCFALIHASLEIDQCGCSFFSNTAEPILLKPEFKIIVTDEYTPHNHQRLLHGVRQYGQYWKGRATAWPDCAKWGWAKLPLKAPPAAVSLMRHQL